MNDASETPDFVEAMSAPASRDSDHARLRRALLLDLERAGLGTKEIAERMRRYGNRLRRPDSIAEELRRAGEKVPSLGSQLQGRRAFSRPPTNVPDATNFTRSAYTRSSIRAFCVGAEVVPVELRQSDA